MLLAPKEPDSDKDTKCENVLEKQTWSHDEINRFFSIVITSIYIYIYDLFIYLIRRDHK